MRQYSVKLLNEKTDRTEEFTTQAENERDLRAALFLFLDNGYTLISFKEEG